jgi:hypothetical protein
MHKKMQMLPILLHYHLIKDAIMDKVLKQPMTHTSTHKHKQKGIINHQTIDD